MNIRLDELKLYLKKWIIYDVSQAIEEIEKVVRVGSPQQDMCFSFRKRLNNLVLAHQENNYSFDEISVLKEKLNHALMGFINDLNERHFNMELINSYSDNSDKITSANLDGFKLFYKIKLLNTDLIKCLDALENHVTRGQKNNIFLFYARINRLRKDEILGIITHQQKHFEEVRILTSIAFFIDELKTRDLK